MWVWLATAMAVAVSANDVLPPEPVDEAEAVTHPIDPQHHRVHNLVLNPEQHSLCELKHIRQIVTHAHCVSKEIENHVCVGTCFSYSVPQTDPETPGDELLDYCDSCQASESYWTTLYLDCEEYGNTYEEPKRIQMITNCSCSPCRPSKSVPITTNEVTVHNTDHHVSELIYKMLPDTHKFKEAGSTSSSAASTPSTTASTPSAAAAAVPAPAAAAASSPTALRAENDVTWEGDLSLSEMSLGYLKKELNLDPDQEVLLEGKPLFKDSASFGEDHEHPRHLHY